MREQACCLTAQRMASDCFKKNTFSAYPACASSYVFSSKHSQPNGIERSTIPANNAAPSGSTLSLKS
jgi:hypothetical protein